jgi:class 3 adenylate cyclase
VGELPSGTVSLLFTDVEGSTRLVRELGDGYAACLAAHRELIREAVEKVDGQEVDCRADELFAVFRGARDAVDAAVAAQRALAGHQWPEERPLRARMGIHVGEPALAGGAYIGLDVNRAARICAAGHGGQILLSDTARALLGEAVDVRELGMYSLAGLPRPERLFQLLAAGLPADFPPLRVSGRGARRRGRPRLWFRARPPTLADVAWAARAALSTADPARQEELGRFAASAFKADRALHGADGFLASVDSDRLTRRLAAHRELVSESRLARVESDRLAAQVSNVAAVRDRRQAVADHAPDMLRGLKGHPTAAGLASLQRSVESDTAELDAAVTLAASTLDDLSLKLDRTRYRGIYRLGRQYVVPFVDEVGVDRRRAFESVDEARDFRRTLDLAAKAKREVSGDWWAGGGGNA